MKQSALDQARGRPLPPLQPPPPEGESCMHVCSARAQEWAWSGGSRSKRHVAPGCAQAPEMVPVQRRKLPTLEGKVESSVTVTAQGRQESGLGFRGAASAPCRAKMHGGGGGWKA